MRPFMSSLFIITVTLVLAACGDDAKGPAEKAGQAIDKAAEKTGETIKEGAQKTGEAVEKAGEKVQDAAR
jgi:ankyrin